MEKGQKAVIRVVALKEKKDHECNCGICRKNRKYYIQDIYESHDFDSSFVYKDGRLKAAIAHRIVDGLETLDINRADKLEVYLIKSADPAEEDMK